MLDLNEIEILQVEKKIRTRVKKQMEKTQKEYYLNEQMRAIQKELGEKDEFKNEIQELEEKLRQKKMPAEAREKCEREIKKLIDMGFIVICCGGGGIPVAREGRAFAGVDAVIDKDLASAKLAEEVGVDIFVIATEVEGVSLGPLEDSPVSKISLLAASRHQPRDGPAHAVAYFRNAVGPVGIEAEVEGRRL